MSQQVLVYESADFFELGLRDSGPHRKQAVGYLANLSIALFDLRTQRFEVTALGSQVP